MNLAFFISKRYVLSNKDSRLLNLISIISIIGISLGVATLIIALSVLNGFEKTLTQKITEFDSHIKILSYKEALPNADKYTEKLEQKLGSQIDYLAPYLSKLAIISTKNRKEGINIKGLSEPNEISKIKSNLIQGSINFIKDNSIVIGKTLATKLLISVGDKVTLFALKNDKVPSLSEMPNIQNFYVEGIFESGMAEYDNMIGYTKIDDAQNLFSMPSEINGIDIKLKSANKIDSLAHIIRKDLRYPYYARTIFEIYRNIFSWIELQKKPIPIILGLIIIVAVFNIISALLILVLEKTNSIGVLKSLGAKSKTVIKIFIYQGIYLSFIGIAAGNFLAWLLMSLQLKFNIIKVPSSVYFVTRVPIEMSMNVFLLISLITFILSLVSAIIPSYFASKVNPVKALRFD